VRTFVLKEPGSYQPVPMYCPFLSSGESKTSCEYGEIRGSGIGPQSD
jgi:hypothetical protein